MNSRWLTLLFVNAAVLAAGGWLFFDTPVTVGEQKPLVLAASQAANPSTASADNNTLLSIDGFHFPLFDPFVDNNNLTSKTDNEQLADAKKTIAMKNREIQKAGEIAQQQAEQITLLRNENERLNREKTGKNTEFDALIIALADNREKLAELERLSIANENQTPARFSSDIALVKQSIALQPDLVRSSVEKITDVTQRGGENKILEDQSQGKKEIDAFSGSVEFGYLYEQDNQITKGINGRLVLNYDQADRYELSSDLKFEFESEDGKSSTAKYRWQLQADYNLDPANLIFARGDLSRSKFASYEQEDIFTVGYGRVFLNTPKHKFNIEIGPGYRFAVPNIGEDAISADEFIVRTRLNYERIISDSLQVKMDTVLEAGHDNSVYSVNFKAQNRIYQELYLIFDFAYKYTQNVPIDTVNEEVSSGLSLLYAF